MYEVVGGMCDREGVREKNGEEGQTQQNDWESERAKDKGAFGCWVVRMIPAGEGIESPGWTFKQDSCDPLMSDSHTNTHILFNVRKHAFTITPSQCHILQTLTARSRTREEVFVIIRLISRTILVHRSWFAPLGLKTQKQKNMSERFLCH